MWIIGQVATYVDYLTGRDLSVRAFFVILFNCFSFIFLQGVDFETTFCFSCQYFLYFTYIKRHFGV